MLIEDGRTGKSAIVTPLGELRTSAVASLKYAYLSDEYGTCFSMGSSNITCDGLDNTVLYIQNNSQVSNLYIHSMSASTDLDGPYISLYKNPMFNSGGTELAPVNLNFSYNSNPNIQINTGSALNMTTSGTPMSEGYISKGITTVPYNGAIVLGYKNSLAWAVKGVNGQHVTVGAIAYFDKQ